MSFRNRIIAALVIVCAAAPPEAHADDSCDSALTVFGGIVLTGTLGGGDTQDWYTFTPAVDGFYTILLRHSAGLADYDFQVFTGCQNGSGTGALGSVTGTASPAWISRALQANQPIYIEVTQVWGSGSYEISAGLSENDVCGDPAPLSAGQVLQNSLGPGDPADWFEWTAPADGNFTVSLSVPPGADFDLLVYGDCVGGVPSALIRQSSSPIAALERVNLHVSALQGLWIEAALYSGSGTYSLTIDTGALPTPTLPPTPTDAPTATPAPPSSTPTTTPTGTPTGGLTNTPAASPTPTVTIAPTGTSEPTSTSTPVPTRTTAPTATPTPSQSPTPPCTPGPGLRLEGRVHDTDSGAPIGDAQVTIVIPDLGFTGTTYSNRVGGYSLLTPFNVPCPGQPAPLTFTLTSFHPGYERFEEKTTGMTVNDAILLKDIDLVPLATQDIGIPILSPKTQYHSGETLRLVVDAFNRLPQAYLVSWWLLLEIGGQYYFAPGFTGSPSPFAEFDFPAGVSLTGVEIYAIPLGSDLPASLTLTWYSALLNQSPGTPGFGGVLGDISIWQVTLLNP